jgi:hypothetical protein
MVFLIFRAIPSIGNNLLWKAFKRLRWHFPPLNHKALLPARRRRISRSTSELLLPNLPQRFKIPARHILSLSPDSVTAKHSALSKPFFKKNLAKQMFCEAS